MKVLYPVLLFTLFAVACSSAPNHIVEHAIIVEEGPNRYVVNGEAMTVDQAIEYVENHWFIGKIRFVTFEKRDYQNGLIERLKRLALERDIPIEWDLPKGSNSRGRADNPAGSGESDDALSRNQTG